MSCCNGPRECADFDNDREGVSNADLARFGGDDVACPNCGSDVFHDAAQCHACGYAISDASRAQPVRAWIPWAAAGVIASMLLGALAFAW